MAAERPAPLLGPRRRDPPKPPRRPARVRRAKEEQEASRRPPNITRCLFLRRFSFLRSKGRRAGRATRGLQGAPVLAGWLARPLGVPAHRCPEGWREDGWMPGAWLPFGATLERPVVENPARMGLCVPENCRGGAGKHLYSVGSHSTGGPSSFSKRAEIVGSAGEPRIQKQNSLSSPWMKK